ncbi:UNVERIFIED_CONTAM: hypothetical protein Sradi_3807200 [Sesamum radiatum]|uniref:Integrase catalytic domain-containing protein n=1 Tax=Sesamum radiatum TaxID=300843 RepID=A0AAW2Q0I4_SESRA
MTRVPNAGRGRRAREQRSQPLLAPEVLLLLPEEKGQREGWGFSAVKDICMHYQGKGHWKRECPQLLSNPGMFVVEVLQRSRRLSKDDMILRLGDGKAVAVEAMRSLRLLEVLLLHNLYRDHLRYGYVYLMRYKSEAFERFKEYRLEVENQTNHKIKALSSDRRDEYLSGEFIDSLKENGIISQWTPPGTPQLNGVAERRN